MIKFKNDQRDTFVVMRGDSYAVCEQVAPGRYEVRDNMTQQETKLEFEHGGLAHAVFRQITDLLVG